MADKMQAHLAMVQGVVNRLAQSSFLLKGWSVVLVSALLAFASNSSEEIVLYIALLPAVVFWALDGYFLWQERLFRALYDHVRSQEEVEVDYGMDTGSAPNPPPYHRAVFSRTISLYHGAVLVTVLVIIYAMS